MPIHEDPPSPHKPLENANWKITSVYLDSVIEDRLWIDFKDKRRPRHAGYVHIIDLAALVREMNHE